MSDRCHHQILCRGRTAGRSATRENLRVVAAVPSSSVRIEGGVACGGLGPRLVSRRTGYGVTLGARGLLPGAIAVALVISGSSSASPPPINRVQI